jgi:hypothetical protein
VLPQRQLKLPRQISQVTLHNDHERPPHVPMAWDSNRSAHRRQKSSTSASKAQQSLQPAPPITPKSSHTADLALQPFLASIFDPAEYLNSHLPPLAASSSPRSSDAVPLSELSLQTQALLSQLSAHTARLTSTLTSLTDEILRSGSRLAYEVEVLRGETLGLAETLTDTLAEDVALFVPQGLERELAHRGRAGSTTRDGHREVIALEDGVVKLEVEDNVKHMQEDEPEYMTKLRTLSSVRSRLDTVIKTFGDAMSWPIPPSELSTTSSFISVSAPEPGSSGAEAHTTEEKGQQVMRQLREEISDLLSNGGGDPVEGIERAAKRVEELKELAKVWKGTAEERARMRFVDSLAKMVEERHRVVVREVEDQGRSTSKVVFKGDLPMEDSTTHGDGEVSGGYGFISRLQKMRQGL